MNVRFKGKIGKDREKEKGEDYSGDNKVMKKLCFMCCQKYRRLLPCRVCCILNKEKQNG